MNLSQYKCPHKCSSTGLCAEVPAWRVLECVWDGGGEGESGWVGFTVARLPDSLAVGHLWAQRWLFVSQHSALQPQGSSDPTGCLQSGNPSPPPPTPHTPATASSVRGEEKSIKISTWSKRRPKPRHHMHSFRAIDDWRALWGSLIHAIDLLPTVATKTIFL